MLANAWTFSPQDALGYYGTKSESGLTEEQIKRNRELYGENCKSLPGHDGRELTRSFARVAAYVHFQAHPRSVQGSTGPNSARVCRRLVRLGLL